MQVVTECYEDEGHVFRQAENIQQALNTEFAFYCMMFELSPADAKTNPYFYDIAVVNWLDDY